MGESAQSLFRRGLISPKQAKKHGVLKKTKVQPSKMADFDDKAGVRDQGGIRDRGAPETDANQIERNQGGSVGMPSKGGSVNNTGKPTRNQINEDQGPEFPVTGKGKPAGKVGVKGPKAMSSGPQYGGPNSRGSTV